MAQQPPSQRQWGNITTGGPVVSEEEKDGGLHFFTTSGTRTTLTVVKSWVIDRATSDVCGIKLLLLEIQK